MGIEAPIVTVAEGKLQGTVLKSVLGKEYLAFKGIPYARPPVGDLRFKPPEAALKWSGIRDASKHATPMAMQMQEGGQRPYNIWGNEDCLHLNIYTNAIGYKRPVMFFIHGGSFIEGTGNDKFYREDYFMDTNVVMIFVNFRLGPLGFLNLGHEVAPGNQGFRDIIFALKWVRKNIEAFGGDPESITIFGNSSGSSACHLLTLLPAAKGLFQKAILQSGTIFLAKNLLLGKDVKNGFRIASLLGMHSDDPIEVIEFLRSVSAQELIGTLGQVLTDEEREAFGPMQYGPIVDGPYTNDPIVPSPIQELVKNDADIPIIIGHTTHESLVILAGRFEDDSMYKYYDENLTKVVRNALLLTDPSKLDGIVKDIRKFYFDNGPVTREKVYSLINLLSDIDLIGVNRKIIDMRNEHAKKPTYVYNYSYLGGEPTIYQFDYPPPLLDGVAHADELSYLFYLTYMRRMMGREQFPQEGTKDRLVMERLTRMWYNFAATGNPTPPNDPYLSINWKPSSKDSLLYLDIGSELTMKNDEDSESRSVYEKFSRLFLFDYERA